MYLHCRSPSTRPLNLHSVQQICGPRHGMACHQLLLSSTGQSLEYREHRVLSPAFVQSRRHTALHIEVLGLDRPKGSATSWLAWEPTA